jgi:hypothetical protein
MNSHRFPRFAIAITAIVLSLSTIALAGPPLICHAIEIGPAKTLPWVDLNYGKGSGGYDLNNLTRDTLSILDSNATVLAQMETLRRATIYARQDEQVAKQLLVQLHARAERSDAKPDALFDFGYLAESYKQWMMGNGEPNPARGVDGYSWVKRAIAQKGSDPQMEFGAAMITLSGAESDHKRHVEQAMAGAKADPLLAQNLASNFRKQTIASLLSDGEAQQ